MNTRSRFPLFLGLLAVVLTLLGCDLGGSADTAILNQNSPFPPDVTYEFEYSSDNVQGEQIEVVSDQTDDLAPTLLANGFTRDDVVSARVDSVLLERLSSPTSGNARPKVFDYLGGAEVYLGTDAAGTRIAADEFQTTDRSVSLEVVTGDVTDIVTEGSTKAFLRLDAPNPGSVPSGDRVRATVYFRIEVEGV